MVPVPVASPKRLSGRSDSRRELALAFNLHGSANRVLTTGLPFGFKSVHVHPYFAAH
jgi:hypothetical protein